MQVLRIVCLFSAMIGLGEKQISAQLVSNVHGILLGDTSGNGIPTNLMQDVTGSGPLEKLDIRAPIFVMSESNGLVGSPGELLTYYDQGVPIQQHFGWATVLAENPHAVQAGQTFPNGEWWACQTASENPVMQISQGATVPGAAVTYTDDGTMSLQRINSGGNATLTMWQLAGCVVGVEPCVGHNAYILAVNRPGTYFDTRFQTTVDAEGIAPSIVEI